MTREEIIQEVLESMKTVFRGVARDAHFAMHAHELTRTQIYILFAVFKMPDGVNIKELAQLLHVTSAAITQMADELVAKGLLERTVDPNDRRGIHVRLTKAAQNSFGEFRRRFLAQMQPYFNNLSDADLHQLHYLLQKIRLDERIERETHD